jgi:hypothetical protein
MRAVRFVVRVTVFMLVGFAVSFGVIAIFNAQVKLDQLAELYLKSFEAPPQLATASTRPAEAPGEPRPGREPLPPMAREAEPATDARGPGETEVRDTVGSSHLPPVASPQANEPPRTSRIAARWPRTTPDATPAEASKATAVRVHNAQSVVDFALPDRASQAARSIGRTDLTRAESAAEHDNARFSSVKVHRTGAETSVHRVPKEFPRAPREW